MALNVTYTFQGGTEFGPRDGWQVRLVAGAGGIYNTGTSLATLNIATTQVNYIFFEPATYGTVIGGGAIHFAPGSPSGSIYVYNDPENLVVTPQILSNYVNYRTASNWSVHPSNGFSFDIWFAQSVTPTPNANYAAAWSWSTVNNSTYNLRTNKYTVFYQYNDQVLNGTTYRGPFAWGWQKGGNVTITCQLDNS